MLLSMVVRSPVGDVEDGEGQGKEYPRCYIQGQRVAMCDVVPPSYHVTLNVRQWRILVVSVCLLFCLEYDYK